MDPEEDEDRDDWDKEKLLAGEISFISSDKSDKLLSLLFGYCISLYSSYWEL